MTKLGYFEQHYKCRPLSNAAGCNIYFLYIQTSNVDKRLIVLCYNSHAWRSQL